MLGTDVCSCRLNGIVEENVEEGSIGDSSDDSDDELFIEANFINIPKPQENFEINENLEMEPVGI